MASKSSSDEQRNPTGVEELQRLLPLDAPSKDIAESSRRSCGRKRKRPESLLEFQGAIQLISSTHLLVYEELKKWKLLFDEPVDFDSINHDHLKLVMAGTGLTRYLVSIRHTKIQKDELAQFYAHLTITRHPRLVIHNMVNNVEFDLIQEQLASMTYKSLLVDCEDYGQLPFHTTAKSVWHTIAYGHDPRLEEQMGLMDLTPIASIIMKILHCDIYPRSGTPTRPHFQVLIAIFTQEESLLLFCKLIFNLSLLLLSAH